MAEEGVEEFRSSLSDLTQNSKPLINMLTMLADDNRTYAEQIVKVIETHLHKTSPQYKLPCLYLMDSIIKNVHGTNNDGATYLELFSKNIVFCFQSTFEKVDEKVRASLYKLRQTWIGLLPNKILYLIDIAVKRLDPAWPITAEPESVNSSSIYVNPKFIIKETEGEDAAAVASAVGAKPSSKVKVESTKISSEQQQSKIAAKPVQVNASKTVSIAEKSVAAKPATVSSRNTKPVAAIKKEVKADQKPVVKPAQAKPSKSAHDDELNKTLEQEKAVMQELLLEQHRKQQELLILQRQVLENELAQAKAQLEEQARLIQQKKRLKEQFNGSSASQVRISAAIAPSARKSNDSETITCSASMTSTSTVTSSSAAIQSSSTTSTRDPRLKAKAATTSAGSSPASNSPVHQTAVVLPTYSKAQQGNAPSADSGTLRPSAVPNIWERMSDISATTSTAMPETRGANSQYSDSAASSNHRSSQQQGEVPPASSNEVHLSTANNQLAENRGETMNYGKNKPGARVARSPSFSAGTKSPAQAMAKESLSRAAGRAAASAGASDYNRKNIQPGRGPRGRMEFKIPKVRGHGGEMREPEGRRPGRTLLSTPPGEPDDGIPLYKRARMEHDRPKATFRPDRNEAGMRNRFNPESKNSERFQPSMRNRSVPLLELPSPSRGGGWAQFKIDHPQEYPLESPPIAFQPQPTPGKRALLPTPPVESENDRPALTQMPVPPVTVAENELQDQMARLQKMRAELELKKRQLHEQSLAISAFNNQAKQFPEIEAEMRIPRNPEGVYSRNGRLLPPGALLPTPENREGEIMAQRPRGSVTPIQTGPEYWPAPATPWYDKERFYVPEHDPRWCLRVASLRNRENDISSFGDSDAYTVVIDGRHYEMFLDGKPRRMKLGGGVQIDARIESSSRQLLIDEVPTYCLGEEPHLTPSLKDGRRHEVWVRGPTRKLWIDKRQFDVSVDAPAERINIGGREHLIKIDGARNWIIVDGYDICPYGTRETQRVTLAFVVHTIEFAAPLKQILIDGAPRDLDLSGRYPAVIIDSVRRGIRFDGGEREIVIDDVPYCVGMDRALKWRQDTSAGGAAGGSKPRLLAFGGPGHEIIIDDQWHEVKFGGEVKFIRIGAQMHKVQLLGGAPEVKILGQIVSPIDLETIMRDEAAGPRRAVDPMGGRNQPIIHQPEISGQAPFVPPGGQFSNQWGGGYNPGIPGLDIAQQGPEMGTNPAGFNQQSNQVRPQMQQQSIGGPFNQPHDLACQQQAMKDPRLQQHAAASAPTAASVTTTAAASVDVNSLLQQLMAAGLLQGAAASASVAAAAPDVSSSAAVVTSTAAAAVSTTTAINTTTTTTVTATATAESDNKKGTISDEPTPEPFPDLTSFDITLLRSSYPGVLQSLRAGRLQCSTCGLRFASSEVGSTAYAAHLDWHFRTNQRTKELAQSGGKSRGWHYDIVDWIVYEEIGAGAGVDVPEVQAEAETDTDIGNVVTATVATALDDDPEVDMRPAASEDDDEDICAQCGEAFEQFWEEEAEEWRLKDAIRYKGVDPPKTYHRVCFEDVKRQGFDTSMREEEDESMEVGPPEEEEMDSQHSDDNQPDDNEMKQDDTLSTLDIKTETATNSDATTENATVIKSENDIGDVPNTELSTPSPAGEKIRIKSEPSNDMTSSEAISSDEIYNNHSINTNNNAGETTSVEKSANGNEAATDIAGLCETSEPPEASFAQEESGAGSDDAARISEESGRNLIESSSIDNTDTVTSTIDDSTNTEIKAEINLESGDNIGGENYNNLRDENGANIGNESGVNLGSDSDLDYDGIIDPGVNLGCQEGDGGLGAHLEGSLDSEVQFREEGFNKQNSDEVAKSSSASEPFKEIIVTDASISKTTAATNSANSTAATLEQEHLVDDLALESVETPTPSIEEEEEEEKLGLALLPEDDDDFISDDTDVE